jgi:hypothetical protein
MNVASESNMQPGIKRKTALATWNSDEIDVLHLQEVGVRKFLKTTSATRSPLARLLRRTNGRKVSCNSNKSK